MPFSLADKYDVFYRKVIEKIKELKKIENYLDYPNLKPKF